jgi:hypothetical protein
MALVDLDTIREDWELSNATEASQGVSVCDALLCTDACRIRLYATGVRATQADNSIVLFCFVAIRYTMNHRQSTPFNWCGGAFTYVDGSNCTIHRCAAFRAAAELLVRAKGYRHFPQLVCSS